MAFNEIVNRTFNMIWLHCINLNMSRSQLWKMWANYLNVKKTLVYIEIKRNTLNKERVKISSLGKSYCSHINSNNC